MAAPHSAVAAPGDNPVFDESRRARLHRARDTAVYVLLKERAPTGGWTGELSASALAIATAVTALTIVARGDRPTAQRLGETIARGYAWLIQHQNRDGGWGDTTRSISNISTTTLGWAALALCPASVTGAKEAGARAEGWLVRSAGSIEPQQLVAAIERRYGDDRTFSIPILTMCALCGRLGPEREGWRHVRQLPFELAALPAAWFGAMRLPVVSYALPALIAIGQVRHGMRPTANPLLRLLRERCRARTLEKLIGLQPENGGFLEAAPLTSFVVMSLAALGHQGHPVVQRGVAFLEASIQRDGSCPIDTNLATWVTTLSINALGAVDGGDWLPKPERDRLRDALLAQQYRRVHPYTLAAPGGWAWTDKPGGVPDADDTAGAIIALLKLDPAAPAVQEAVTAGAGWLLGLQNRDGGIPTFCRGWGRLPFDRSSPDITAHVLRAWAAALKILPPSVQRSARAAVTRAVTYLLRAQRPDGTWIPLWFGHEQHPAEENPVYGTARVVLAMMILKDGQQPEIVESVNRGLQWLITKQNADGGWCGGVGASSSVEETGLAVEALAAAWNWTEGPPELRSRLISCLPTGGGWLADAIEQRRYEQASPIGFYFAKLWYFERLYPQVFATGALVRLAQMDALNSSAGSIG